MLVSISAMSVLPTAVSSVDLVPTTEAVVIVQTVNVEAVRISDGAMRDAEMSKNAADQIIVDQRTVDRKIGELNTEKVQIKVDQSVRVRTAPRMPLLHFESIGNYDFLL